MKRFFVFATLCALVGAASLYAHHSYGDFVRDQPVTIEGQVENVMFANPHVMITMKTKDGATFKAEWNGIAPLQRAGITASTIKTGDWIVVTGSRHRDPENRLVSLLQEVRRPADNWSWGVRRPASR